MDASVVDVNALFVSEDLDPLPWQNRHMAVVARLAR
jgi:hypothetical protein